jgi:predicted  nucleic acid-binding Zn-ribbon protein
MKILGIFSLLVTFSLLSQADAEYYRYTDQHGNKIYTEDLDQVPPDQRSSPEVFPATRQLPPFGPHAGKTTASAPDLSAHMENERRRLAARKTELEAELRSLVKENKGLKQEQKVAVTPEEIKAINIKAVDFNIRFSAYQEKKAAYDAQVKAFNEKRTTLKSSD